MPAETQAEACQRDARDLTLLSLRDEGVEFKPAAESLGMTHDYARALSSRIWRDLKKSEEE